MIASSSPRATRIRILSDSLINKIAAGEVIERPASVVKELVENALDAGAGRIEVEVEAGGRARIRVADDGCGMSRDDALLALERHATSKLQSDEDLFRVGSLGFRGEALPSIAGVSRLSLATGEPGALAGVRLQVDGGTIRAVEEAPNPGGTEIEVRRLFFNTPVRLRFLRSPRTEMAHLNHAVQRLALAHPEVGFQLQSAGKTLLDLAPVEGLRPRVEALLGRNTASKLHSFYRDSGPMRVEGLVSDPSLHRSSNASLFLFVNGRPVRDRTLVGAVLGAYRGTIPRGRYPVAVLFLDLPPEAVDVNVHPTKDEVRFRDGRGVWRLLNEGLNDALARASSGTWETPHARPLDAAPSQTVPPGLHPEGQRSPNPPRPGGSSSADGILLPLGPRGPRLGEASPALAPDTLLSRALDAAVPAHGEDVSDAQGLGDVPSARRRGCPEAALFEEELQRRMDARGPAAELPERFADLVPLGQFARTFLLLQWKDDLVVIDQHAAHERVLFERLRTRVLQPDQASQRLLVPELLELDRSAALALCEQSEALDAIGIEISDFGDGTVALHSAPAGFAPHLVRQTVLDLSHEALQTEAPRAIEALRYNAAALLACHASVRAGHSLSFEEIRVLLHQLDAVEFAYACPHGRPLMVRFPRSEVARWFVRD